MPILGHMLRINISNLVVIYYLYLVAIIDGSIQWDQWHVDVLDSLHVQ